MPIKKTANQFIVKLTGALLKAGLALSATAILGCSGLFYYPDKEHVFFPPEKNGFQAEDVYFQSEHGEKLHAWWIPARPAEGGPKDEKPVKGTIVFFHGNAENMTSHYMNLAWTTHLGYNLFVFDYPGYGSSEGSPYFESVVLSGVSAIKWVHANKDPGPLIIYGQSIGGITALRCIEEIPADIPIKAVVADSTFLSYLDLSRSKLAQFWITWLFQPVVYLLFTDKWAPKHLEKIPPRPLLVIHGDNDGVVPYEWGQQLFAKALEPKQFIHVENGVHGSVFWTSKGKYRKPFLEWLDKL